MSKYNTPKEISDNSEKIINEIFESLREKLETDITTGSKTVKFKDLLIAYFKSDIFKTFDRGTYYTSYTNDINISHRKYIWISSDIGQSITYPFENFNSSFSPIEYLNPHMFKVDIDKIHNLLVSGDIVNGKIFNLGRSEYYRFTSKFNTIFRDINKSIFGEILDFKFEANLKILLFIEAFNKIIDILNEELDDKIIYIDGYKNEFDQNEIAFCNFISFIPNTIITKYRITKIENKENPEINKIIFPYTKPLSMSEEMINILDNTIRKVLYRYNNSTNIIRVYCDKNINIYYDNINSGEQSVYNCTDNYRDMVDMTTDTIKIQSNKQILENNLYNKYIKYKVKYIKLKKKLSL
jgi:hypothetical protein